MKVDIFIRTYKNDLEWLTYCLHSIHKHLRGWNKIIISIPMNQVYLLAPFNLTQELIVTEDIYEDDYLGQQVSKIFAYEHSEADYIMFMDSDCIVKQPCNVSEFFEDGKPVLLKTLYDKVGDAICWKGITEKFLGEELQFEYMRRLPIIYHRATLVDFITKFPKAKEYILSQPNRSFSEFNAVGGFIDLNEAEKYEIVNTDNGFPESPIRQFWSWGGITNDVKKEIESYLK